MNKTIEKDSLGLLCLIGLSKGIRSRIRLQKLVCLIQFTEKELSPFSFSYKSYYYGPYAESLRKKVDELIRKNLIGEKKVYQIKGSDDMEVFSYFYDLTREGRKILRENFSKLGKSKLAVSRIVKKYGRRSNETIIKEAKMASDLGSCEAV